MPRIHYSKHPYALCVLAERVSGAFDASFRQEGNRSDGGPCAPNPPHCSPQGRSGGTFKLVLSAYRTGIPFVFFGRLFFLGARRSSSRRDPIWSPVVRAARKARFPPGAQLPDTAVQSGSRELAGFSRNSLNWLDWRIRACRMKTHRRSLDRKPRVIFRSKNQGRLAYFF